MSKRSFKDRKDGKYVKPTDSIHAIMPYIYDKRTEAEVYTQVKIDITKLKEFIDIKNKTLKNRKITYFHAITTAVAKTIYNRPYLNRFISGKRTYQRNELSIAFVAKNKMSDEGEERLIFLRIKNNMTLDDISKIIWGDVEKTRSSGTNDMEDALKVLTKLPRWLLRIVIRFIKWLDFHGWVPKALSSGDVNFATVLLSNLGSIKSPSCYHHLNNYGTNSIIGTIGTVRTEYELDNKGKIIAKEYVDIGLTIDERIADGFYFAKSIKLFEYILNNPKLLEEEISKDFEYEEK